MNKIDSLNVLKFARNLISKKENWTKNCNARGEGGRPCSILADDANCWCALGALGKATNNWMNEIQELNKQAKILGYDGIVSLNDVSGSHELVLKCYDMAIQKLEQENNNEE